MDRVVKNQITVFYFWLNVTLCILPKSDDAEQLGTLSEN